VRGKADAEQGGKADRRDGDVDQAVGEQRARVAFKPRAKLRQQRVKYRWMVQIVRGRGELECMRVKQAHIFQVGRGRTVALDLRDVGNMRHFIETLRDVLACRADDRGENEQRQDHRCDKGVARHTCRHSARLDICTGTRHEGEMRREGLNIR
jgi:hypothetical protein